MMNGANILKRNILIGLIFFPVSILILYYIPIIIFFLFLFITFCIASSLCYSKNIVYYKFMLMFSKIYYCSDLKNRPNYYIKYAKLFALLIWLIPIYFISLLFFSLLFVWTLCITELFFDLSIVTVVIMFIVLFLPLFTCSSFFAIYLNNNYSKKYSNKIKHYQKKIDLYKKKRSSISQIIRLIRNFIISAIFLILILGITILGYILIDIVSRSSGFYNKEKDGFLTTPISVPFDLTKKGNKIEFFIKPKKTYTYRFSLLYYYYLPIDDPESKYYIHPIRQRLTTISVLEKYFERKYSEEEWKEIGKDADRVIKLSDHSGYKRVNGELIRVTYSPTPVLVNIKIIKINKEQENIIFDKILKPGRANAGGNYRHRTLTAEPFLEQGKAYKVTVQSMKDAIELKDTKIHIGVINDHPK